jgi:cephalosporin-C deacetylase
MPMLDMPLAELLKYKGSSPCPSDIDEFWDERLSELSGHNANPVLEKADFECSFAECFHLYFTGTKNARIHAKYIRPKNIKGKAPLILNFHGYSGSSGAWVGYMPYVAEGYCVAALDCRGQGGLSEDTGGFFGTTYKGMFIRGTDGPAKDMLFVQQYLDLVLLAKITMAFPESDETRVAARGGSQGGGLTLAAAALVPEIKLAAPRYPFLSDFKRVWDMDLDIDAYEEIRFYFMRFDPRHEREEAFFTKLGYIDVQNLAKRIKAEVFMATGLLDKTCPPSTQFAAYNKINSKKQYVLYHDYGHSTHHSHDDLEFEFIRRRL